VISASLSLAETGNIHYGSDLLSASCKRTYGKQSRRRPSPNPLPSPTGEGSRR